jgi:TonB-dependent SusC/RagA subfamily outer membrane receptor
MMNQTKSSRYRLLSFMLLTPLVLAAASLLTFSCQKETLDTLKSAEKGEGISLIGKGKVEIGELKIGDGIMTEDSLKNILKSEVTSGIILKNGKTLATFAPNDNFNDESGFTVITTNDQTREGDIIGLKTDYKNFEVNDSPDFVQVKPTSNIFIKGNSQGLDSPLYILDGKEILHLENIKPDEIESISVLKDRSATALYGDKAKNGVILITTKLGSRR